MEKISSYSRLQEEIQLMEVEQALKSQLLQEQIITAYESLKPLNLIKSAFDDFSSSPNLFNNVSGSILGLASGYLSKKLFIGTSGNLLRKLLGSILQFGVTNIVAQHPDAIKSFGRFIMDQINQRKATNSQNRAR
jgi:hypothetical protein